MPVDVNLKMRHVHGQIAGREGVLLPTTEQKVLPVPNSARGTTPSTVEHWLFGMTRAVLRGLLTRWVAPVE
jgi:hypothetical protein